MHNEAEYSVVRSTVTQANDGRASKVFRWMGGISIALTAVVIPQVFGHDATPGVSETITDNAGTRIPYGIPVWFEVKNCSGVKDRIKIEPISPNNVAGSSAACDEKLGVRIGGAPLPVGRYRMALGSHSHVWDPYYNLDREQYSQFTPGQIIQSREFEVYRDRLCRSFTTTARYTALKLNAVKVGNVTIPFDQINLFNNSAAAYFQLKGNWCYFAGPNYDAVDKYRELRLSASITGNGIGSLLFKIRPVGIGQIINERYGTTASRYRIAETRAIVSIYSPVEATVTFQPTAAGGPGATVTIPADKELDIYTLKTDTLLTGSGNGSCVGTNSGPCTVDLAEPTRYY
jgi:hypothetical protein